MFSKDLQNSPSAGVQERRRTEQPESRSLGHVIACDSGKATISSSIIGSHVEQLGDWSVGRLVTIVVGTSRVVALTRSVHAVNPEWSEDKPNTFHVELELMGEVRQHPDGAERFSSGISAYPFLGAHAHHIRSSDLVRIYDHGKTETRVIGRLSQEESIEAAIHMPSMLSKHFAVVGSTGSGKSTAVSLLLREAIASNPKLRVLILDPHNEFAAAFPEHAVVIDTDNLDLPFWLFRLDEFAEVLFRGRPPVPDEIDALRDLIPEAKRSFKGEQGSGRKLSERNGLTADTPVPYRIADLLALIDERIGKLDGRNEKPYLRSLKLRLAAALNDPRYKFMFSSNTISDTIMETVAFIFRIPGYDRPISTFQLAGIPSEVVNSVASVLCRMAFEVALWSKGAVQILVVCEEAHRYVPADPNLGFFPTRQAIARIAKEGRKYGCSLGVITQRPNELDQTILSQCSTVFTLRLSNDRDQDIIAKALPSSSVSALSFISSLANGEAIAFGEAVPVPMRLKFNRVKQSLLPSAHGAEVGDSDFNPGTVNLGSIIERMRSGGGPDISEFQDRVSQVEASVYEAVFSSRQDTALLAAEPSSLRAAMPAGDGHLEPYNPGMLPGLVRPTPDEEARTDTRIDRYGTLLGRARDNGNPDPAAAPSGNYLSQERHLRRESLLKKPLDSAFKR